MRVWLVRHSGAGLVARVGVRACVCACELGSCVFVFAVCITLFIVWLGVDLRVCGGVRHISIYSLSGVTSQIPDNRVKYENIPKLG